MTKTTVYLPEALKAALERLAAERGCSEAELIRQALTSLTRGENAPLPRVGLGQASGPPIAENIDEALAKGFGTG